MKKVLYLSVLTSSVASAHLKPFEHVHTGSFHPEEMLIVMAAFVLGGLLVARRLVKQGEVR